MENPVDSYTPELPYYPHQLAELREHWDDPVRAILWEQGTGKTKLILDTTALLYDAGKIDCLLVVAPNGVHRNWIEDEVPKHLPQRLRPNTRTHFYSTSSANTQWHKRELELVARAPGLAIIAVTYDIFRTDHGKRFVWKILQKRRCLYVLDEHTDIKSPKAKTTKSVVASGHYAPYRRIMDGTPITLGPFDVYSPVKFLAEDFWKKHDMADFGAFKTYFGIYKTGYNKAQDREFQTVVGYRRLGELNKILDPISTRVLKEDVLPDLPPKVYSKLYHEMTPKQAALYKDLKEHYVALLNGEVVQAALPIVQLLRLQQIVCGYVPTEESQGEEGEPVRDIDDKNPRLDMARWYCDHLPHKGLIWCRFTRDIDLLMHALGPRAVRYDGQLSEDQRAESKHRFINEDGVQFFVANPAAAARGLTLVEAKSELYYSNSFKLRDRLQSEDRAHRIGQEVKVAITDLTCAGTVDTRIIANLRNKQDVAAQVTGDKLKEWI